MTYIDPGAGSMLLQLLSAGVIAGLLTLRRVRTAFRDLWNKVKRSGNRDA